MISKKVLIGVAVIIAISVIILAGVNFVLAPYDLNVFDVLGIIFSSFSSSAGLPSLDSLTSEQVGLEVYDQLKESKASAESTVGSWREKVDDINNDSSKTAEIKKALGDKFTLYMFSVYESRFKVFEWKVVQENGTITVFEPGKPEKYDATVEFSYELTDALLGGDATREQIIRWVKLKKIKIVPLTMAQKAISLFQRLS